MGTLEIPLGQLEPGDNARKVFHKISELADTIEGLGLLQNLVVVPSGERYKIRAGERRYRAMMSLVERESPGWTLSTLVPCYVLEGSDGDIEALVENIQREPVPPWDDGAAFDRLVQSKGFTFEEIGKQIGKSRAHVSLLVRISRGLSPKLIPILSRIGKQGPNVLELGKLASLIDKDTLGPDHDAQRKWLENYLTASPKKRKKYRTRKQLEERIRKLEDMDMPANVRAIVDSIVVYLGGGELVFPAFAEDGNFSRPRRQPEPFVPTELEHALEDYS